MHLTDSQANRYHRTIQSLFSYVNRRAGIATQPESGDPHLVKVRTVLVARVAWRRPDLVEDFVRENPDGLSPDCLDIVRDWQSPLFDEMVTLGTQDGRMLFLHPSGLYAALGASPHALRQMPSGAFWVRMALLPFEGKIVIAPPSQIVGPASPDEVAELRRRLRDNGGDALVEDAQELGRRLALWRESRAREPDRMPAPMTPVAEGPLPPGYHRGALAGLSDEERAQAKERWLSTEEASELLRERVVQVNALEVERMPASLGEAIALASTPTAQELALELDLADGTPCLEGNDRLASQLAERLPHEEVLCELVLSCSHSVQLATIQALLHEGAKDITDLPLGPFRRYVALPPYSFLFASGGRVVAWIAPELRDSLRAVDYDRVEAAHARMRQIGLLASAMVERCGLCTFEDFYERYRPVADDPLDREAACRALATLEAYGNVTYETVHVGQSLLLVNYSIADDPGAMAALIAYHRDIDAPPLERSVLACEKGALEWLCQMPAARALRDFVDTRIPDGENDYCHADEMVLDAVVTAMCDHEDYNTYMGLMRRYGMEGCEGMRTSHAVGRLLTNLFNAMPQWERNGWSAESDMERVTGMRKLYNPDGTVRGTEPTALPAA